jgi:hypothetical protein
MSRSRSESVIKGEIRYGLRPSLLSPLLHSNSKQPRQEIQKPAIEYTYPQLLVQKLATRLGQYSIGRVGQLSIGADTHV